MLIGCLKAAETVSSRFKGAYLLVVRDNRTFFFFFDYSDMLGLGLLRCLAGS